MPFDKLILYCWRYLGRSRSLADGVNFVADAARAGPTKNIDLLERECSVPAVLRHLAELV